MYLRVWFFSVFFFEVKAIYFLDGVKKERYVEVYFNENLSRSGLGTSSAVEK